LIGFTGTDFVILVADASHARSILKMKGNEDKIMELDDQCKMFAMSGDSADRTAFCEYIKRNLKLYEFRTGLRLGTHGTAHFTRREMADALRRNPYQANLLLAGLDEEGAQLYYIDYLGTMHQVPFGVQGYASNFVLSIFDRHYKPTLTVDEGLQLAKMCVAELHTRFLIAQPDFVIKILERVDGKSRIRVITGPKED
jgi:20S proteasome subunit beta 4